MPPLGVVGGFEVEGDWDQALDVLDPRGQGPEGGVWVVSTGGGYGVASAAGEAARRATLGRRR